MLGKRIFLGPLVLLAFFLLGCGGEPLPSASTRRMAERLREVAAASRENAYSPEAAIELLRSGEEPPDERSRLQRRFRLARALLYAGQTEAAVAELETLVPAVEQSSGLFKTPFLHELHHLEAIAWLRLGEQQNCLEGHNVDSCLLPIRGEGVHRRQEGSRRAMAAYRALAERDPDDLNALWLLNLAAMTVGEWPQGVPERFRISPEVFAPEAESVRWRDVAPGLGVAVDGLSGGVVADDLDGDGWLDLMVSAWGFDDPLRLFLADGQGGFVDRSRAAGLDGITGGLNLLHADVDDDGDNDVLVLRGGWQGTSGRFPNSLLLNRGDATFDDVTEAAGLLDYHPSQTAAWADFDRDGRLDLFVGNESVGRDLHPCRLFRNLGLGRDGQVRFEDVAERAGVAVVGFVKGVAWGDVDDDGWPDLYVSRLLEPNLLLRNRGAAAGALPTFEDTTARAGVAEPRHSFPTFFFDFDQDGDLDLFVSGFPVDYAAMDAGPIAAEALARETATERPRLYRNRGDGTFDDVTREAGLWRVLYTMGSNVDDVDGDGFPDLYLGTGAPDFRALVPNRMFLNDAGKRFLDVTAAAGVGHLQKGHGVAFADFDADGDLDLYAVMGGAYSGDGYPNVLFENPGHGHPWVTLRLEGTRSNRSAIGARVRLELAGASGVRNLYRTVSTGGSFGSQSLQLEIGLGEATTIVCAEVRWPSGEVERFAGLEPGHVYRLREGSGEAKDETSPPVRLTGDGTGHRH